MTQRFTEGQDRAVQRALILAWCAGFIGGVLLTVMMLVLVA